MEGRGSGGAQGGGARLRDRGILIYFVCLRYYHPRNLNFPVAANDINMHKFCRLDKYVKFKVVLCLPHFRSKSGWPGHQQISAILVPKIQKEGCWKV